MAPSRLQRETASSATLDSATSRAAKIEALKQCADRAAKSWQPSERLRRARARAEKNTFPPPARRALKPSRRRCDWCAGEGVRYRRLGLHQVGRLRDMRLAAQAMP